MAKDEKVDGPKIAARILSSLPEEKREKLVQAISSSEPELAAKIKNNILTFDDIITLTEQSVQLLAREISEQDWSYALANAKPEISELVLRCMSQRKRSAITDEFDRIGKEHAGEVRLKESKAKTSILQAMEKFYSSGMIRTKDPKDLWV